MTGEDRSDFEAVIGLEVHAQLSTKTKIFCACPTTFGAPPNSQTCPVCLGHPGTLPVLNREAVRLAVRGALALASDVRPNSVFARKNYFYPDLPKGYQISQYDAPLAIGGSLPIEVESRTQAVRLTRLHLEEDAGKLLHEGFADSDRYSYVDLNRAGVPLVEIVSEPDLHSPEEAYLYLQRLRSVLRYAGVCDGNMEQGSLRCDANVSIRPRGAVELGTRTELKNLNSFRNVQRALEFEIERQIEIVRGGGVIRQQTVLWDAGAGLTRVMREKEEASDYRYFPEPDLPPLTVTAGLLEAERATLPELPGDRKSRLVAEYGLAGADAHLLTLEAPLADFFEAAARESGNPRLSANFVVNDLLRLQNEAIGGRPEIRLEPGDLAGLIRMVDSGKISLSAARREIFPEMHRTGRPPGELVRERGLEQLRDEEALGRLIREVLDENAAQLKRYRAGKRGLAGYFIGEVMKRSGGRADPERVRKLLLEEIGE